MDNRIAIILPNDVLVRSVEEILARMDLDFPVYQLQTQAALELAKKRMEQGAQAIVSRGMTAAYLRARLNIPVCEIKYDFFHFATAMEKALAISDRIAVIGFIEQYTLAERAKRYVSENQEQIHVEILPGAQLVEQEVQRLSRMGITTFVGGSLVVDTAHRLGFEAVLVEADEKAVEDALQEALYELRLSYEREERFILIRSILNSASNGMFAVDSTGTITISNPIAKLILGKVDASWQTRTIHQLMPKSMSAHTLESGRPVNDELIHLGESIFAVSSAPILVEGMSRGAVFTIQEADKIQKLDYKIRKKYMQRGHVAVKTLEDVIGESAAILECKNKARRYAGVDSTVLILGETGTGKELFAQSIHNLSGRADRPFVAVNCAALSPSLLESELFGYVKGAFTGARNEGKAGIFELAHTGTIFLDEIGELPLEVQSRLLRVIQEKQVTRVGDDRVIPVDVRILTATNRDLAQEVAEKRFRVDLYYRLNVLELHLPSLNQRREDIPLLVRYFVEQTCRQAGFPPPSIPEEALNLFCRLPLQGNIRELANLVERALVVGEFSRLDQKCLEDVLSKIRQQGGSIPPEPPRRKVRSLSEMERDAILDALAQCRGNKSAAARMLGISQSTLWRRLKDESISM